MQGLSCAGSLDALTSLLVYVPGKVHQQSSWAAASKVMTMSVCGNKKKMIYLFF